MITVKNMIHRPIQRKKEQRTRKVGIMVPANNWYKLIYSTSSFLLGYHDESRSFAID